MNITALIIELVQVREVFGDLEVVTLDHDLEQSVTDVIVQPANRDFSRVVRIAALGKRDNA